LRETLLLGWFSEGFELTSKASFALMSFFGLSNRAWLGLAAIKDSDLFIVAQPARSARMSTTNVTLLIETLLFHERY